MNTWNVEINLSSFDDADAEKWITTADAVLTTSAGTELTGYGRARRNPADRTDPAIGEELAAARALRHLADQLLKATSDDISENEHHAVHLARRADGDRPPAVPTTRTTADPTTPHPPGGVSDAACGSPTA